MSRLFPAVVFTGSLLMALPVAAQMPASGASVAAGGGTAGRLFVGGIGGAGAVQKVGGVVGGELGIHVTDQMDLFGEGIWMQDVATRRRLGLASEVASILQTSQSSSASGTVDAPALCVEVNSGARAPLRHRRCRSSADDTETGLHPRRLQRHVQLTHVRRDARSRFERREHPARVHGGPGRADVARALVHRRRSSSDENPGGRRGHHRRSRDRDVRVEVLGRATSRGRDVDDR